MRVALGLVMVVGCTSKPNDGVQATFGGVPALVAARIDDGTWEVQAPLSFQPTSTIYDLPDGELYDVISVCKFSDGILQAIETRATRGELDAGLLRITNDCSDTLQSELAVHIQTSQGPLTLAWPGGFELSTAVSKDYTFEVPAEPIDFVAANPDHLAVVRNIDATSDVMLDPIDVDAAPANEVSWITFDPFGPDITPFSSVSFSTSRGASTFWETPPGQPHLLPALAPGDFETLTLGGYGPPGTGGRAYDVSLDEEALPSAVPPWIPPIGDVVFDPAIAVTWTPFESPYATQILQCVGRTYQLFMWQTRAWARLHDEATLALDHTIPGWDPSWTFPIAPGDCSFNVSDRLTSTEMMVAYSASFP